MKRILRLIDLVVSDSVVLMKFVFAPIAIFSFGVVSLSIAGVIAYTLMGQSDVGLTHFSQIMNLSGTPIFEPFRIVLMTFNWFALIGLIAYSGFFFGSRYFTDLQYRLMLADKRDNLLHLSFKSDNNSNQKDQPTIKNAANS